MMSLDKKIIYKEVHFLEYYSRIRKLLSGTIEFYTLALQGICCKEDLTVVYFKLVNVCELVLHSA